VKPQRLQQTHQRMEARFAARMAALLSASSTSMPHHVGERLRVSREQALVRARAARQSRSTSLVTSGQVAAVQAVGDPRSWRALPDWLWAVLPLALLVAGLLLIEHVNVREQIRVAADIDTMVLGDDLPPAAYADPGFVQFLRRGPAP
jgi:hypothetical protein